MTRIARRWMTMAGRWGGAVAAVLLVAALLGCDPDRSAEVDQRRTINLLSEDLSAANRKIARLEERIERLQAAARPAVDAPSDALALLPAVATLAVDERVSGPIDADNDGKPDAIRFVLTPRDAAGYTIRRPSTFVLRAFGESETGELPLIAEQRVTAAASADRWFETFFGNYYALNVPLSASAASGLPLDLLLRASITDVLTGQSVNASVTVPGRLSDVQTGSVAPQ